MSNKKQNATDAAKKTAETVKETVKENVKDVKEAVKENVKEAKSVVKETVKEAKETVKEAVASIPTPKKASHSTKETCFVEFDGKQIPIADITEQIKKNWKKSNSSELKKLEVYIKAEESRAYYVINETEHGHLDI